MMFFKDLFYILNGKVINQYIDFESEWKNFEFFAKKFWNIKHRIFEIGNGGTFWK